MVRMVETLYTDELVDGVQLALVSGVGPRHRQDLLVWFGSPAAVLAASKAELELAAAHRIDVLVEGDDRYPRPLRQIHDPPGVLFRRGTASPQDEMAIAIVGTRHAAHYGLA
jgi:DNA processing protein